MTEVFIDGSSGTTGLRIRERIAKRHDITELRIPDELRHDTDVRLDAIHRADIAILCLPDDASREIAAMADADTVIIDTSSAHRTADGWTYGFPELSHEVHEAIRTSHRISNPGCHASGFIAATYPLVSEGIVPKSMPLTAYSLTGYSGGGKNMISEYNSPDRDPVHESCRIYATSLMHKHLPEMQKICSLEKPPVFAPIVGDYYSGMATTLMLPTIDSAVVLECLSDHYSDSPLITVEAESNPAMIYSSAMSGRDSMKIFVGGNSERTVVTALFDNLGKGASGAAIQNMNIAMGAPEYEGLVI